MYSYTYAMVEVPDSRPLSDIEVAFLVAEATLRSQFNPGRDDIPFQVPELYARLGLRDDVRQVLHAQNPDLDFRVAEYCWRLVGLGCMVPRPSGDWGAFFLTKRGKAFLQDFDPALFTSGGIDAALGAIGYDEEDPVRAYARLAQDCFLSGHHASAIVMVGAATESLTHGIAAALQALPVAIVPPWQGNTATARQTLSWLNEALTTHRRALKKCLTGTADDWIEPLAHVLAGTGTAIRLTRNEYGHPTGLQAGQQDALELLTLFPRLARLGFEAISAASES